MATKENKETVFNVNGPYQDEVEILSVAELEISIANSLFLGNEFGGSESMKTVSTEEESDIAETGKKYKVLVTASRLPQTALSLLQETCHIKFIEKNDSHQVIIKKAKECDAIFLVGRHFHVDKEFLNSFDSSRLKVVGSMSNSYENLDVIELSIREVKIGVCRSVPAETVAEAAIGLALAVAHKLPQSADAILKRDTSPGMWLGQDIEGSTAGVVTMGPVGMALLCKLHGLGVSSVLYSGSRVLEVEEWADWVDLPSLVEECDFIFETSELSSRNEKQFNRELFNRMKCTAVFINVGHGGVVDTDALTEALRTRKIWGAGLDEVYPPIEPDHPLNSADNCMISNQIGFNTEQTLDEMATFTAFNILAALEGEQMPSQVRFKMTPRQLRETAIRRKITATTLLRRYAARVSLVADYKSSVTIQSTTNTHDI